MSEHTPGPWAWYGDASRNVIYLGAPHGGRRYVMKFKRWGMTNAQPVFQPISGRMVPAADLLKFEVGDKSVTGYEAAKKDSRVYRYDICGIDCADARLIASAPDLLAELKALVCVAGDMGGVIGEVCNRARDVIAKAENG